MIEGNWQSADFSRFFRGKYLFTTTWELIQMSRALGDSKCHREEDIALIVGVTNGI